MAEVTPEITKSIDVLSLRRLLEISTILSSTLDLKQLLLMVIDTATDLTGTEAASMLLVDRRTGALQFVAATGMQAPKEEMAVPMEGSLAGWIVQNGRPLLLDDVQQDDRHYDAVDSTNQFVTKDMLGVPLINRGEVIGALEVINKREGGGYTDQDVALMQALASQAAVAIENARLFQQTDLISELMHEVKNPLMAITTAGELLAREAESAEKGLLELIQKETRRLSKLTRDFLELSRLESGRVHLNPEAVDLEALIKDVFRVEASRAAERQVTLRMDIPTDLPRVQIDPDRMQQVLINLVSNAIKYNREHGWVAVSVVYERKEVVIHVSDSGAGIDPDYLPHLFERFYRVPDKEGYSEGTGLGLAISNKIIEAHNGRIEVTSSPGQGSTFSCYIPNQVR